MPKPPIPSNAPAWPAAAPVPAPEEAPAPKVYAKNTFKSFLLPAYILKAVSLFAGDSPSRPAINCVYLDLRNGRPVLIATDGRVMGRYDLDPREVTVAGYLPDGISGFRIPTEAIKIPANVPAKAMVSVIYEHEAQTVAVTFDGTDTVRKLDPKDVFPSWTQVWPRDWDPTKGAMAEFALGFPLLQTVATAAKILYTCEYGRDTQRTSIQILQAAKPREPIRLKFPRYKEGQAFRAILMPIDKP